MSHMTVPLCECVCTVCVSEYRKHTGCFVMYVQLSFLHTQVTWLSVSLYDSHYYDHYD